LKTAALPGGGTVTWGWRGPPCAALPSILGTKAFGVLAPRQSPCPGAVPALGGHAQGPAAGHPCQPIWTSRLCQEGHFCHRHSFGCGDARDERKALGSLCMKLQRCREQVGFPHYSLAMHQGTVAATLCMVGSSSWKEVHIALCSWSSFSLHFSNFSPPLAFTLEILLEIEGSPLSLTLAPSSRCLLLALHAPSQLLCISLPSSKAEFIFLDPEEWERALVLQVNSHQGFAQCLPFLWKYLAGHTRMHFHIPCLWLPVTLRSAYASNNVYLVWCFQTGAETHGTPSDIVLPISTLQFFMYDSLM